MSERETKPVFILGIETSGSVCSASLSLNGQLIGENSLRIKHAHSRILARLVEQLLANSGIGFEALSALALSAGPGSFTGLRIGYSLAKGIAHARRLPLIEVPTLDILAFQQGATELPVLALIDAHRGEIFYALYCWEGKQFTRRSEYQLVELKKLAEILTEPTLLVGGDLPRLQEQVVRSAGANLRLPHPLPEQPAAWALQTLAFQKFEQQAFASLENSEPFYMRAFKGVM